MQLFGDYTRAKTVLRAYVLRLVYRIQLFTQSVQLRHRGVGNVAENKYFLYSLSLKLLVFERIVLELLVWPNLSPISAIFTKIGQNYCLRLIQESKMCSSTKRFFGYPKTSKITTMNRKTK